MDDRGDFDNDSAETEAKPHSGGGKRRGRVAIERYVQDIQNRLAAGESRAAIIARYANRPKTPIPASTVNRYVMIATKRWMDESQAALPSIREARMHELRRLSRKAEAEEGAACAAVARYQSLMMDVEGSRAPERVDVRAAVAVHSAPPLDLSRLDDDALAALELVALQAERAGTAPAPRGLIGDASIVEHNKGDDDNG